MNCLLGVYLDFNKRNKQNNNKKKDIYVYKKTVCTTQ